MLFGLDPVLRPVRSSSGARRAPRMVLGEQTVAGPPASPPSASRTRAHARRVVGLVSGEIAGYALLAIVLTALLWSHVSEVDGFYLDEWFYVHGSQYIWEHLPGGLVETIPEWNRGPQRLYSTLLAFIWGPFEPSTAFTLSHVLNVALLVSAIGPTALLARRVIELPALRVLAVTLGVAVPWLAIANHQLTENLAFPLFLWAVYATIRCAEEPSPWTQLGALAAIAALALCRLNLVFVLGSFFVAVLAGEVLRRRAERDVPFGPWLRRALRREALVVAAALGVAMAAVIVTISGGPGLGAYGAVNLDTAIERLFGTASEETRRTALTYSRSLVVGGFVFPFAIGLGVGLAGVFGRAGPRLVIPSLVTLASLVIVVVAVSVYTVGAALEERYVFYVYTPVAVLAVAGLKQAYELRGWIAAGSALALWPLIAGHAMPAVDAGNFFAAPAGAFWTRVVQHRLVSWEEDLFGWMFLGPTGWMLVALGLIALFVLIVRTRNRPRVTVAVLAVGLGLCGLAQVAVLDFDLTQELHGTAEAPGGIALSNDRSADRETWLDKRLPAGEQAAVVPGLHGPGSPLGGTERLSFWNRELDATVALRWNGAAVPAPPGYAVVETQLGAEGFAGWSARPEWVAAHGDDPRVQFSGELIARSPVSPYALYRTAASDKAMWTSVGLGPDGAVLARSPVSMKLDRELAEGPRAVELTLHAAEGAERAVRWRVARAGGSVADGRLRPGQTSRFRLEVPACEPARACPPIEWRLRASGRSVALPVPGYGAPGPARPVVLKVSSAHIADG